MKIRTWNRLLKLCKHRSSWLQGLSVLIAWPLRALQLSCAYEREPSVCSGAQRRLNPERISIYVLKILVWIKFQSQLVKYFKIKSVVWGHSRVGFVLFCFYNIIVVCNSYKFIFFIKYYVLVLCMCSNDISKHCLH